MDFMNGQEAEHKLPTFTDEQKTNFALALKCITEKLNIPTTSKSIPQLTINDYHNNGWNVFPESFCESRKTFINHFSFNDPVYVHGDLTSENIIISDDGAIHIIDFADSHIAPYYYEWPPIVFDLFGCDPIMMAAYFGDYHHDEFYEYLTVSLLIHEYGAGILEYLCKSANISINMVVDVAYLKAFLIKCLCDKSIKVK